MFLKVTIIVTLTKRSFELLEKLCYLGLFIFIGINFPTFTQKVNFKGTLI